MSAPFNVANIEKKIQAFEEETGFELIVAATDVSDPYPGAAWRGGVLLGLLVAGVIFHFYEIEPRSMEILVCAGLIVLMTWILRVSGLLRYFVLPSEALRETAEKAAEVFSRFQSEKLGHQASILMFFSMCERKIHLLVDSELKEKLSQQDLDETVMLMSSHFKEKHYAEGVETSVTTLQQKILTKVGKRPSNIESHVANKVFWI